MDTALGTERSTPQRPLSTLSGHTAQGDAHSLPKGSHNPSSASFQIETEKPDGLVTANNTASSGDEDQTEYPGKFALAFIIVALILSIFLIALDMTIVATAIPTITAQFKSLDQVGWYGSAFFLTVASFQSTWGKAFKYFPLKTVFMLAIFVFEIGSLICAVANNSTTLIVGRAIAGAGASGLTGGVYTIIGFSVPPQQRPAFTGILGATYGVASAIGPLLGGVFTDKVSWRWCFYINLPVGAISAAIIFFFFTAPPASRPVKARLSEKLLQMDLVGTFTIMAAVISFLLAMQWGGTTKKWSDSDVIGTLVAFGLLVIVFIVNEWWMGDRALLPPRLFKTYNIMISSIYIFFFAGPFFVLIYYLPIYFQSIKHTSASDSGIRNLPFVLAVSIFSTVSGGLIATFGHLSYLMVLGSVILTIGSGLVYTFDISTPAGTWIGYQLLAGIGGGVALQIPVIVSQALAKPEDLSSATAMILFLQTMGAAIWVSAAQTAFVNRLLLKLPQLAPNVNPALVIRTGASELHKVFSGKDLEGVITAYGDGLKVTFILCIALAGISVLAAVCIKPLNLNKLQEKKSEAGDA
ncbi:MFS gliotoxin efflux transporter GliA [Arthroderma uncinatum]|uniref:MFS gliotoxin efflux transporter GliA n=1 Tax=Arthroderma uncinatum TaxID=74035 RepID=UPI00144A5FA0|nr:MFS gliotoxin efflux transporter GliA [Arthroderma uncinatum]KAF3483208.1 MFS gliotoxin efflux transporter GliA [Arthroderma uncinatum]